jgi:hypothetical protein
MSAMMTALQISDAKSRPSYFRRYCGALMSISLRPAGLGNTRTQGMLRADVWPLDTGDSEPGAKS